MAVSFVQDGLEIGFSAGVVWGYLNSHGSVSLSRIAKDFEMSRDRVMQAVGWLEKTRLHLIKTAARVVFV